MTDTRIMLYGIFAIFATAGGVLVSRQLEIEKQHAVRVCARTCYPFVGESVSSKRCTCNMGKKAEDYTGLQGD